MSEDTKRRAEQFLRVANDAASAVARRFVSFLAAGAYVAVTIVSMSDAKLVHGTVVKLPVANVDVPLTGLFGFFTVAPWLILLMHTDLLLQMSALSRKLCRFRRASDELVDEEQAQLREGLASFYYVQFLAGETTSRSLYLLAGMVLRIAVIVFPLALLLGIQIRFLPFHSVEATWWHRLAVLGDVLLILTVWPQLSQRVDGDRGQGVLTPGKMLAEVYTRGFLGPAAIGAVIVIVSVLVATIPNDARQESSLGTWWLNRRNLQLANEDLTAGGLPPEVVNTLKNGDPREREAVLAKVSPLAFFQGRDLRNANLVGAVLPKFDLRARRSDSGDVFRTQLQGANFSWAEMPAVWMDEADAEGAVLDGAGFQEASLVGADLRKASLKDAKLQHARLPGARLDGVTGRGAKLQGADLSGAQLADADLTGAQLQGANLRGANLQGATLADANLEGANLSRAALNGARFTNARMTGVNLLEAVVERADFGGAELGLSDVLSVSHDAGEPADVFKNAKFKLCTAEQKKIFPQCQQQLPSDEHLRVLMQHLVNLACADAYVARGLVEQVHYTHDTHALDPGRSALPSALSQCLSQAPCVGMALLERTLRDQLEGDANTAEDGDEGAGMKAAEQNADSVGAAKVQRLDLNCNPRARTERALASVASPSESQKPARGDAPTGSASGLRRSGEKDAARRLARIEQAGPARDEVPATRVSHPVQ